MHTDPDSRQEVRQSKAQSERHGKDHTARIAPETPAVGHTTPGVGDAFKQMPGLKRISSLRRGASFKRNVAFAEKTAAAAAREKKRKEEEAEAEEEEEDGARLLSLWAQASLDDQRVCGINVLHIGSGPDKQRADKDFSDGSQSVPFRFSAEIYCVVQFP